MQKITSLLEDAIQSVLVTDRGEQRKSWGGRDSRGVANMEKNSLKSLTKITQEGGGGTKDPSLITESMTSSYSVLVGVFF